jgi:hypothetical protein
MTNLSDLTTSRLKRILAIMELIETLQGQIHSVGGGEIHSPPAAKVPKRRRMSAAARARIAAGARARWARGKGTAATASKPAKKGKHMSRA